MKLLKYMIVIGATMMGMFTFIDQADAAQIGIGTEQKIVQNPLELERQAIEEERQKEIARQKKLAEEKRIAEEKAKEEAEKARLAKLEAERKAEEERKAAEQATAAKTSASATQSVSATPVSTSKKVITVESTAYSNDVADNKAYGGRVLTATGHDVTDSIYYNGMRIIAVDPAIIPLGSKVHIQGVGDAIALDTGGRIKGHIVDLLVDSKQDAIQWGRRHIEVTLY
jgi:3D (Asp-Asp-Asp) domain-containing protein